jgi:hypothetical protein
MKVKSLNDKNHTQDTSNRFALKGEILRRFLERPAFQRLSLALKDENLRGIFTYHNWAVCLLTSCFVG